MEIPTNKPVMASDLAHRYIDDVMKLNSEFGMANALSDESYKSAVTAAARAFVRLGAA